MTSMSKKQQRRLLRDRRPAPINDPMGWRSGAPIKSRHRTDDVGVAIGPARPVNLELAVRHNDRGNALASEGRFAAAAEEFRDAIRLMPDVPKLHRHLGNALRDSVDFEGAILAYRQAIALNPADPLSRTELAGALFYAGRIAESLAAYDEALRTNPTYRPALFCRAKCRLAMGDFTNGWGGMNPTWTDAWLAAMTAQGLGRLVRDTRIPGVPEWSGCDLDGTLLLSTLGHGYGDAIHAVRFAPEARRRVRETVLLCDRGLARLFGGLPGIDRAIVADRADLPPLAAQCQVWDLPALFRVVPETMQGDRPYLSADDATIERWRPAIGAMPGIKIGILWSGNPAHGARRNFHPADLAPLARIPGVSFVSLQRGVGADQAVEAGFPIVDLGAAYAAGDMCDTAAVMSHCDLVISPDTGMGHLAGAIGRPTWLALNSLSDWRWMIDRDDSPWYPTVRLFRQSRFGDWSGVFRPMAEVLAGLVGAADPGQR
jgi:tetratricopeptide (TPR) repeat protein